MNLLMWSSQMGTPRTLKCVLWQAPHFFFLPSIFHDGQTGVTIPKKVGPSKIGYHHHR